jgi:hypothetical protein
MTQLRRHTLLLFTFGVLPLCAAAGCKPDCADLDVDECAESACGVITARKIVSGCYEKEPSGGLRRARDGLRHRAHGESRSRRRGVAFH